jgi:hypothetical protein
MEKELLGYSLAKRPIYQFKAGRGDIKILLWSQMHGDEITATKSLFDLMNYLVSEYYGDYWKRILSRCRLYIIPMLNPDGASLYTRENAAGDDLNRDVRSLINPESRILKKAIDRIRPHYAFNLHDQTHFYNVKGTRHPATISFLAPAQDEQKTVTANRREAMRIIENMYRELIPTLGGYMGRYKDDYCLDCFGDFIQSTGAATILIESGFYPGDTIREKARAGNFLALLAAFSTISEGGREKDISAYFEIPENEKRYYDLLLENVLYEGKLTDMAIRYKKVLIGGEIKTVIDREESFFLKVPQDAIFYKKRNCNGEKWESVLEKI